jgi:hypothetical protein
MYDGEKLPPTTGLNAPPTIGDICPSSIGLEENGVDGAYGVSDPRPI